MILSWHDWLLLTGWTLIAVGVDVGALALLWRAYKLTSEESTDE